MFTPDALPAATLNIPYPGLQTSSEYAGLPTLTNTSTVTIYNNPVSDFQYF